MEFQPLTLADIGRVRPFFLSAPFRTCDFTVGGMFMWRDYFKMKYTVSDGVFYSALHSADGTVYYNLPLVADTADATVDAIARLAREQNDRICFCTIPESCLSWFRQVCPDAVVTEQVDFADYLYNASDLATLAGKKFSGQRNQISQFKRAVQSFSYTDLTADNLPDVTDFFANTYKLSPDATEFEREENRKVSEVLLHLDEYGMFGGVLYADGRVVGFSLGEIVGDTLFTHIEKADRNVKGAYQMTVQSFASRYATGDVRFINREEDVGDPGLRVSKLSYHPVALLKKYTVAF